MTKADLVLAGDKRVLINGEPPRVDIRIVADDNYKDILEVFKAIKAWDVKRYIEGSGELMPYPIRRSIGDFLNQHEV